VEISSLGVCLMRSFRQKPVGWRGESYRHYLASKGFSSSRRLRYFAFREDGGLFKVEEGVDFDKEMRRQNVSEAYNDVVKFFNSREDAEGFNSAHTERFMEFEFKDFADRYLADKNYTRKQFKEDVMARAKSHADVNGGVAKPFDWSVSGSENEFPGSNGGKGVFSWGGQ
jgi:hypothetical protein